MVNLGYDIGSFESNRHLRIVETKGNGFEDHISNGIRIGNLETGRVGFININIIDRNGFANIAGCFFQEENIIGRVLAFGSNGNAIFPLSIKLSRGRNLITGRRSNAYSFSVPTSSRTSIYGHLITEIISKNFYIYFSRNIVVVLAASKCSLDGHFAFFARNKGNVSFVIGRCNCTNITV